MAGCRERALQMHDAKAEECAADEVLNSAPKGHGAQ